MIEVALKEGWERLPNGFDVAFRHGVPIRISDNGRGLTVPENVLSEEISSLAKLHVHLGEWISVAGEDEHEARVFVHPGDFTEVLMRLGRASAATFADRYHKPIKSSDVDWDRMAYLRDFQEALNYCELSQSDVDEEAYIDVYVKAMHEEVRRLLDSCEPPPVKPE
jgi:hypothetical protein